MKCPECGGKLRANEIELYCRNCGLVVEEKPVNLGKEYAGIDHEKALKRRRTGQPITWLNPDFSTAFDFKPRKRWKK